jgi:hypothetical protein
VTAWSLLPIVGSTWSKPSFPIPTVVEIDEIKVGSVVVLYRGRRRAVPLAAFFHCFMPIEGEAC